MRDHHTEKKQAFENGATRSQLDERFDLIPWAALKRMAARFGLGAKKHGARNWEAGDETFAVATFNHLLRHAALLSEPGSTDDDLGAVLCNAAMLALFEERGINLKETVRKARERKT